MPRVCIAPCTSTLDTSTRARARPALPPTREPRPALTGIRSRIVEAWFHPVDAQRAQGVPFPLNGMAFPRFATTLGQREPVHHNGPRTRLPFPADHRGQGRETNSLHLRFPHGTTTNTATLAIQTRRFMTSTGTEGYGERNCPAGQILPEPGISPRLAIASGSPTVSKVARARSSVRRIPARVGRRAIDAARRSLAISGGAGVGLMIRMHCLRPPLGRSPSGETSTNRPGRLDANERRVGRL